MYWTKDQVAQEIIAEGQRRGIFTRMSGTGPAVRKHQPAPDPPPLS